eukprot:5181047-Pyramimonas_sp.AAC.1
MVMVMAMTRTMMNIMTTMMTMMMTMIQKQVESVESESPALNQASGGQRATSYLDCWRPRWQREVQPWRLRIAERSPPARRADCTSGTTSYRHAVASVKHVGCG